MPATAAVRTLIVTTQQMLSSGSKQSPEPLCQQLPTSIPSTEGALRSAIYRCTLELAVLRTLRQAGLS